MTVSTLLKICAALDLSAASLFQEVTFPEFSLTRSCLEKMAEAVHDDSIPLSPNEKWIVSRMRMLAVLHRSRRLSINKVQNAWYELKERLPEERLRILLERMEDARQRRKAAA